MQSQDSKSQILVSLSSELSEVGDVFALSGVLPLDAFQVGERSFQLNDGIHYDLTLLHSGTSIVLTGTVDAEMVGECARCLEPAQVYVEGPVESFFLFSEPDEEEDFEDDEFELIPEDGLVDLAPAIEAALVLETPMTLLCKDDCKGICPECGVNLNEEQCSCASLPDPDSPFAALKDFKVTN